MFEVPPVQYEPEIYLTNWNLARSPADPRWFLIGIDQNTRSWRKSTYIDRLDLENARCETESGRIYHLVGRAIRDGYVERILNVESFRQAGGETLV